MERKTDHRLDIPLSELTETGVPRNKLNPGIKLGKQSNIDKMSLRFGARGPSVTIKKMYKSLDFCLSLYFGILVSCIMMFDFMFAMWGNENIGVFQIFFPIFVYVQIMVNYIYARFSSGSNALRPGRELIKREPGLFIDSKECVRYCSRCESDTTTDERNSCTSCGMFHAPGNEENWVYCSKCEMYAPPRTHHCVTCDTCILKRDHHCFITGQCIGQHNQGNFVIMLFYCAVGGIFTILQIQTYLSEQHGNPFGIDFWKYFPGVSIVLLFSGYMTFKIFLAGILLYLTCAGELMAVFFFGQQVLIIVRGQTTHEYSKDIKSYNRGIFNNIESVLGKTWYIRFLIPISIQGQQTCKIT